VVATGPAASTVSIPFLARSWLYSVHAECTTESSYHNVVQWLIPGPSFFPSILALATVWKLVACGIHWQTQLTAQVYLGDSSSWVLLTTPHFRRCCQPHALLSLIQVGCRRKPLFKMNA